MKCASLAILLTWFFFFSFSRLRSLVHGFVHDSNISRGPIENTRIYVWGELTDFSFFIRISISARDYIHVISLVGGTVLAGERRSRLAEGERRESDNLDFWLDPKRSPSDLVCPIKAAS